MSVFSPLAPVSDSTSSSRPRVGGATVRKAKLQDAVHLFDLVNSLSGDGTLLRRSYAEICENVRDFVAQMTHAPSYVTFHRSGKGFREAADCILQAKL